MLEEKGRVRRTAVEIDDASIAHQLRVVHLQARCGWLVGVDGCGLCEKKSGPLKAGEGEAPHVTREPAQRQMAKQAI